MFQPGISGNPRGRPKGPGGGRAQALAALDRMLGKEENQQTLFEALEKEFRTDPVRFFRNTVVPLIPRRGSGSQSRLSPVRLPRIPASPNAETCPSPSERRRQSPNADPAHRDAMSRRSRQTAQPVPAVQPVACYSLLLIPQPDKKGVIMSLLTENGGQHPVVRNQNEKNRTFSFRLLF